MVFVLNLISQKSNLYRQFFYSCTPVLLIKNYFFPDDIMRCVHQCVCQMWLWGLPGRVCAPSPLASPVFGGPPPGQHWTVQSRDHWSCQSARLCSTGVTGAASLEADWGVEIIYIIPTGWMGRGGQMCQVIQIHLNARRKQRKETRRKNMLTENIPKGR